MVASRFDDEFDACLLRLSWSAGVPVVGLFSLLILCIGPDNDINLIITN